MVRKVFRILCWQCNCSVLHLRRYLVLNNGTPIVKLPGAVRIFFYSADLMHKILCNRGTSAIRYILLDGHGRRVRLLLIVRYIHYILYGYCEFCWLYHCGSYVKYKRTYVRIMFSKMDLRIVLILRFHYVQTADITVIFACNLILKLFEIIFSGNLWVWGDT